MSNPAPQLVQKLWNYCNILRDDSLSYGDYVEQLTFLLFLKMADEQSRPPFNKPSPIPKGKDWPALLAGLCIVICFGFSRMAHGSEALRVILNGPDRITNECHVPYIDPGVRITDAPVSLAAGVAHSLALKVDGSVVAWGLGQVGQTNIPGDLGHAVAIAANGNYSLALKADGSVAAWGDGTYGETNIPPSATNVVAIAAGGYHGLALKADGSVVGWGANASGQIDIPAAATNVVAIAAGRLHSLALKSSGSIIGWGFSEYGQLDVLPSATNVVAFAAGDHHNLALRADGSVVTWGFDDQFHLLRVPARATNVIAIAARDQFSMALLADGTVVTWGVDHAARFTVIPTSATNIVGIAAGGESYFGDYCLALKADGSVVGWGENLWGQATGPPSLTDLDLPYTVTGDLNTDAVGTYTLTYTATNMLGEIGTATRTVVVVDTTPPELTCPTNLVVELMDARGATVSFTSRATDLCSGVVPVTCHPPSGSGFPLGVNTVVCTAVDDAGNRADCRFTVTVAGAQTVKMNVLDEMVKLAESQRVSLLDLAVRSLTRSLTAEWWKDEMRLNPTLGRRVFTAETETILVLHILQRQRYSKIGKAVLRDWIGRLVRVDQILAVREIEVATDAGAAPKQLTGIVQNLAYGNKASRNGNDALAISFYERAWSMAIHLTSRLTEGQ